MSSYVTTIPLKSDLAIEAMKLLSCFPNSMVYTDGTFRLAENHYFCINLSLCKSTLEIKSMLVKMFFIWVGKFIHNYSQLKSILKGFNEYFGSNFSKAHFPYVLKKLSSGDIDELVNTFIKSGFDADCLLEGRESIYSLESLPYLDGVDDLDSYPEDVKRMKKLHGYTKDAWKYLGRETGKDPLQLAVEHIHLLESEVLQEILYRLNR